MRQTAILVILAIVLVVGSAAGWYWWTAWRFLQSTDDAYVQSDTIVISPKVEGYITDIGFGDNEPIAAGQVLFVIDDRDFAAKLAQEEAAVATAQAVVATYVNRLQLQRAMIEQANAAVQAAEADLDRAQRDYKRYAALVTSDFASRQRFETAEAELRKAQAELGRMRAALVAEQNQLTVIQSQQREAEARLAQAQASLQLARNELDNTIIRAPVDGVAGNRAGRVGQYVRPGMQLVSLVPLPNVYVTANFKETQLTRMRPGQRAVISVDAYPDQKLTGIIESFSPASGSQFSLLPPENATGNFTKIVQRVPLRIALPDNPLRELLRPGLSVRVTVDTRGEPAATQAGDGLVGAAQARAAPDEPGATASIPALAPTAAGAAPGTR
jgi:membrane fusion protein, multidrug efflux system